MLLLLDLEGLAVLEGPLDDVGLGGCALDELALLELRPELAEVLELDQVPDGAEGRVDDGRLADGGGGGNGRHCENGGLGLVVIGLGFLFQRVECLWNGKLKVFEKQLFAIQYSAWPHNVMEAAPPTPLRSRQYARDQFVTGSNLSPTLR